MRGRPARRPPARSYRTTAIEGGAGRGRKGGQRRPPAAESRHPGPRDSGAISREPQARMGTGRGLGKGRGLNRVFGRRGERNLRGRGRRGGAATGAF